MCDHCFFVAETVGNVSPKIHVVRKHVCDYCFFVAETVGNVNPKIHVVGMKWEVSLVERRCIRSGWTFESAGSQWGELEQWTQVGGGTDWSLS